MNTYLTERLKQRFPGKLSYSQQGKFLVVQVTPSLLKPVCSFLKEDQDLQFSILRSIFRTADNLEPALSNRLFYMLYSSKNQQSLFLQLPYQADTIPSLVQLWPIAAALEADAAGNTAEEPGQGPKITLLPGQHQLGLPLTICLEITDDLIGKVNFIRGQNGRGIGQLATTLSTGEAGKLIGTMDGYSGTAAQLAYFGALEQALGLEIPAGAGTMRSLILELCRLGVFLDSLHRRLQLLGLNQINCRLQAQRLALAKLLTAIPQNSNFLTYPRLGGVASAPAPAFWPAFDATMASINSELEWLKHQLLNSSSLKSRLRNLGKIDYSLAKAFGLDTDNNYLDAYDRFIGLLDDMGRTLAQLPAMGETARIQSSFNLKNIPQNWDEMTLTNQLATCCVDGPSGPLAVTMLFDNAGHPAHLDIRGQSFYTLAFIEKLLPGCPLEDLDHIMASFILTPAELDR